MTRKNTLIIPIFIWGVVGILAVVLMLPKVYGLVWSKGVDENVSEDRVGQNNYQAVFLDNNQIYFGHLKNLDSEYPILRDVYYIEISETASGKKSQVNRLVKLGETEPHKPKNEMILNRQHILFFENMKADSPVVKAIEKNSQNK